MTYHGHGFPPAPGHTDGDDTSGGRVAELAVPQSVVLALTGVLSPSIVTEDTVVNPVGPHTARCEHP